ncbi:pterin 4 alpha carbinolamine dehydratase-domain-containing protein [Sordaria brevicollis]|uniref:4a-hydroxytetrahydrobiopterin dehydratase n=1 Tax=Sordaria brevicollis TaxID=83679 RepID=A0AAE0UBM0_SORBR|nr:pterin 4 alpha carbinolamine dehydratase-domain-containing protein [Sordaria brevicollis]
MSFTITRTTPPKTVVIKIRRAFAGTNPTTKIFFSILTQTSTRSTTSTPKLASTPTCFPRQQQQQHQQQLRKMSTSEIKPQFSEGSDPSALSPALNKLLLSAGEGGKWALTNEGVAIERTFKFKTFAKTWDFMTAVSLQCKLKNHHPEWSNVFNTTFIRWTTHVPKGLSSKDIELAAICDSLAKDFGEQEPTESCAMPNLADMAVVSSGDCCTPKHLKK